MCIKINEIGKQEVGIWWVQKRFPRYGVPIWSLWPNIRFLPSIVAEKNATKNEHICSMCIKINKVGKQEVGIRWVQKRFPRYGVPIWSLWPNIRFLPSIVAEKNVTKNVHICSMTFVYKNQLSRQTGSRNLMDPKTLPTIWGTYMTLVTKYQISVINSCWEKCDEKCAYMFNVYKDQLSRQTGSRNLTGPKTLPTIWYTYMMLVTKYQISAINSYWEKCDEKYLGRTDGRKDRGKTVYSPPPSGCGGIKRLNLYDIFYDRTRKRWPFNTGDHMGRFDCIYIKSHKPCTCIYEVRVLLTLTFHMLTYWSISRFEI